LEAAQDDELIIERIAALDIGKATVVCCSRVPGEGRRRVQEVTTHSTMTRSLQAMADRLIELGVTRVVMEATSDYWKPFYYVMEDKLPGGMFLHMRDRVTGPACSISPNTRVMFVSYRAGRWCAVSVRS